MVFYPTLEDQDGYFAIETGSPVVQTLQKQSAVELLASRRTMTTNSQRIFGTLSAANSVIPKGSFYPEHVGSNTSFLLEATKSGQAFPLTDEDLADEGSYINAVNQIGTAWAAKYATWLDNATLGVSGGPGVPDTTVPYTSVYYSVRHTVGSYTANDNYSSTTSALLAAVSTTPSTGGYNILSNFLATAEDNDEYDEANTVIIAHRSFRTLFRSVKNSQGDPMFFGGATTVSGTLEGAPVRSADLLFNIPIVWSNGARVSATASDTPTGNPLMIVANRNQLLLGVRSGPESKSERIPGKDVTELEFRSRRAFVPASGAAFSVLEKTA
jgi:phage protein U